MPEYGAVWGYITCEKHEGLSETQYGPFASIGVSLTWLEDHCPKEECDLGIAKSAHKFHFLTDPIRGISKSASVDYTE